MALATESRPSTAPAFDPPPAKRNVKKILSYVGVGILGLGIGAATGGATPEPKVIEKTVTVDPTADQIAALDAGRADLATRTAQLESATAALAVRETAVAGKEAARKASTFDDGVYQVGVDIQPGTYATAGGDGCYWEKSTGGSGIDSIIDNDNVDGPAVVVIEPSVKFFKSSDCGTWTKR